MTPEDWQQLRDNYPDWREATIHDLRLRFCATMLAISLHRRKTMELNEGFSAADMELWSILEEEGF